MARGKRFAHTLGTHSGLGINGMKMSKNNFLSGRDECVGYCELRQ